VTAPRSRDVAIFGAGIAGLTAAHELVERGFRVEIWETAPPSPVEAVCAVGGMARTQWTRDEPGSPPDLRSTQPIMPLPEVVRFAPGSVLLNEAARTLLEAVATRLADHPHVGRVEVRGWTDARGGDGLDEQRAAEVVEYLTRRAAHPVAPGRLVPLALGLGRAGDWTVPDPDRCYVDFDVVEDWIPGEHGFRFFPSFYRNVFDTMQRTPLPAEDPHYVETPSTVYDNLVSTTSQGVNPDDPRRAFVLPRSRPTSLRELLVATGDLLRGTGFPLVDVTRFQLKVLRFMTSCTARREAEYEAVSWWGFVEGDRYGTRFQRYLDRSPQALVAMTARECDARTHGAVTVQLLLDHLGRAPGDARVDATLNGPTSTAWFAHWRRYLEHQGVVFHRGTLVGFERPDADTCWPVVEVYEDGDTPVRTVVVRGYTVVAVPLEVAQRLAYAEPRLVGEDFDRLRRIDTSGLDQAHPSGVLRHLSGIQYYFPADVRFVAGHTVYPDAAWGLSSIAQPQFWVRRRGWWDGYAGLLSVDIADFHTPSPVLGRPAWECTRDEIAREVWRQIRATLKDPGRVPEPVLYHLDENIHFGRPRADGASVPSANLSPLLINRAGEYRARPGRPGGYTVHPGGVVLAGTYMQTYTRLTTMEAANESGRHAANAVLDDAGFRGDRVRTWSPEDTALGDAAMLLDLDARLFAARLPHAVDILALERWNEALAWLLPSLETLQVWVPRPPGGGA
jgi:uncharacterized protein with NAD-binding domain and iron-sulfur cluster